MAQPIVISDILTHLVGLDKWLEAAKCSVAAYTDAKIMSLIPAMLRRFERESNFTINQVQCYTANDGAYTNAGGTLSLDATPIKARKEDAYDYIQSDSREFFHIILRHRPVINFQRLRLSWNGHSDFFTAPTSWLQWDKYSGRVHLVPYTGAAYIQSAAITVGLIGEFARRGYVPGVVHVDYQAGLPSGWQTDEDWADLKRVLGEFCALAVLNDISELYDAGIINKALSGEGMSQNISYERFTRRKQELSASVSTFQATLNEQETPLMMSAV